MNYKPTELTTFLVLVFTVFFSHLHAQIDCQEAVEIELIGAGSMGLNAQSILIPNHTTVDSIMLEIIAEDTGANPMVTFTVGSQTVSTPGKQLMENRNGNIQTGSDRVFQAVFAPAATVSMTIADANAFSFVAYVYRPASNNLAATRSAEVLSTYHDASVQLVQIPAHEETRNLLVTIPVSDLRNDSRIAKITASAGGVSQTLTFSSYDPGLNASLRVANFTLTDVPGNATTLMIRSESPGGGAGGSGNGDSFFTGTAVVATNQCDCGSGFISVEASQVPSVGHAISQSNTGVANVQNAIGVPINKYAKIYENSDYLILELQSEIEVGDTYDVKWSARNNTTSTMIVSESDDGINFNYNTTSNTSSTKSVYTTFTASVDTRYVRFDKGTIVQVPGLTVTGNPQVCFGSEDYRLYGIAYDYVSTGTDCEEASSFPVEWLDFSVSLENEHAQLKWSTASELNNEYFTVERSFDGIEFDELDFMPAAGTTHEVSNYTYQDLAVTDLRVGRVYYRIRQTDTDGVFAYSNILELTLPLETPITVLAYPNPATTHTRIRIGAESTTDAELRIFNSIGRAVYSQRVQVNATHEIIDLDVSTWAAGFYIIQLSDESRNAVFKLAVN